MSQVMEGAPLEAGREAISRHAWHEAFDLLREADSAQGLGPEDLEAMAEAAWWTGHLEDCISARERAYAGYVGKGAPRRAAMMALAVAQDYFAKQAHSIGAGWFNRAERLLEGEEEGPEHGHVAFMDAMSHSHAGDLEAVKSSAQRMLDIGMRFGDRDLQAYGLLFRGRAHIGEGKVDEGLAMVDEATVAAVGGELGQMAAGMVYCIAISTTAQLGDYDRAGQWTEASKRWCERQSIAGFPGVCRVHRAEILRLRGSWAEAEQEARQALSELKNFNLEVLGEGYYELGEIRFRMGDLEAAEEAYRQAHELGMQPQPGLALLRLAEGRTDAAAASIKRALQDPTLDRLGRAKLLPGQIAVCLATGELDSADASVTELEEIASVYDSASLQASALCARGELQLAQGDPSAAAVTLERSWRLWNKADLPYEAARARAHYGLALRAEGDEDGGVLELQAALAAFQKLGGVIDSQHVAELLGERVHKPRSESTEQVRKTFMFTDIVNSTRLAETLGAGWGNVLSWHNKALREVFASHAGEVVKQTGDGFFVAFDGPRQGVECAVAIQERLRQHREEAGFAPDIRIGLHCAAATRRGRDYEGVGVHEASRIGALAAGGEILASKDVIQAAKTRFRVSAFRTVELKGVKEPLEVASIQM